MKKFIFIFICMVIAPSAFSANNIMTKSTITPVPAQDYLYVVDNGTSDGKATISAVVGSANALTASALAANGDNCSSGSAPLGVNASGASESCFDVWTEAENTSAGYAPLVSPSFTTPTLGVAAATSINKVAITAPATGSTLTIADGKTLTATNTVNLNTMTDGKWCKYSTAGTALDCNVDPVTDQVGTLTNTKWCSTDGSVITCTEDAPSVSITGTDAQVLFFDGANAPAGDAGMTYDKATDTLTVGSIATTATGQSIIDEGLVVNNDGGDTETHDFIVNTDLVSSAFECDAGDDLCLFNVAIRIPEMAAAPALDLAGYGLIWVDSSNSHFTFTDSDGVDYDLVTGGYAAVTLDVNADTLLSLSTQAIGLDTQTANYVFAGAVSGAAAVPAFRALVSADIPDLSSVYLPIKTIGIADNNLVEIDDASVTQNDYAKFTSAGLLGRSYSEVLGDIGAAPSTAPTFATSITGSYLTASEILITDGSKNIVSAPVATYPSLTELSYIKGLSSAVQTQITAKGAHAGQVWTGTHDFGGAVIEITNGADPTIDAAGEVAVDTTSDHIEYYGGAKRVIGYKYQICFALEDPVDADDNVPIFFPREAITITDVYCQVDGGTSVAMVISDGTNALESITCDDDGEEDDGSIVNGTFTALERMEFDLDATSGTNTWLNGCITYVLSED